MPLPLAQRLLATDTVSFYSLAIPGGVAASRRFAQDFNGAAAEAGTDLVAIPWREHAHGELYRRGMEVLGLYRVLVVLVVVTIAGMSIFTTVLKGVNERVREIGTLRSLGFRRGHVVGLFTLEGGLLALVASASGLVIAVAAIAAINLSGLSYSAGVASQPIPLTVSLQPAAVALAAVFLTGACRRPRQRREGPLRGNRLPRMR